MRTPMPKPAPKLGGRPNSGVRNQNNWVSEERKTE